MEDALQTSCGSVRFFLNLIEGHLRQSDSHPPEISTGCCREDGRWWTWSLRVPATHSRARKI